MNLGREFDGDRPIGPSRSPSEPCRVHKQHTAHLEFSGGYDPGRAVAQIGYLMFVGREKSGQTGDRTCLPISSKGVPTAH